MILPKSFYIIFSRQLRSAIRTISFSLLLLNRLQISTTMGKESKADIHIKINRTFLSSHNTRKLIWESNYLQLLTNQVDRNIIQIIDTANSLLSVIFSADLGSGYFILIVFGSILRPRRAKHFANEKLFHILRHINYLEHFPRCLTAVIKSRLQIQNSETHQHLFREKCSKMCLTLCKEGVKSMNKM